ncbi:MAG: gluconate 2-dehydrogenase subunit 3 family protein [Acidobacteriota bacterium]|jgi:hypothetical protein
MSQNVFGDNRRETIKIIGAIGVQCAFPFAGDELYGQHEHHEPGRSADPGPPQFFNKDQFAALSRLTELILPGSLAAKVPHYIDLVVRNNPIHKQTYTEGLAWLASVHFLTLPEKDQLALLEPLCAEVDRGDTNTLQQKFFRLTKNMTADGYFTSRPGLLEYLGFKGNQVLAEFPECKIDEH